MSQRHDTEHSSRSCLNSDKREMYSSNSELGFDKQSSQNYEELFDSGYNSNLQSKTFLDLESELEPFQEKKIPEMVSDKKLVSTSASQQWTDSGVCITDSGLGINEDDNFESQSKNVTEAKESPISKNSTYKIWEKQNSEGDTLLHLAIIEDLEDVACSIIQNASSSPEMLNSYNYLYQTPLHLAVLKRQMNVIQHLISRGVSLTFQDNLGNTPLHIACKYSLADIVQYFLITSHKTLLSSNFFQMRNYEGDTCIHLAACNTNYKILEMLIRSGANVNVQEGKSGKTVLHWAVENLNVQLVYFLLKKCNASVYECTFSYKTPLYMAWKINNSLKYDTSNILKSKTSKIISLLLEYYDEPKLTLETLINGQESELSSDEE